MKVADNWEFYIYSELLICGQAGADEGVKFQVTSDPPNHDAVNSVSHTAVLSHSLSNFYKKVILSSIKSKNANFSWQRHPFSKSVRMNSSCLSKFFVLAIGKAWA